MKVLFFISRILIGIVFTFSGFVKAIDPLGSAYKFADYFGAFGMQWLEVIALPMSFLLSAVEFMVGFALIAGIFLPLMSWGALFFMAVFTPLTLYIAIENPVSDCGCFGDALVIGNWETFLKNLVFLIPTLYLFYNRRKLKSAFSQLMQTAALVLSFVIITGLSYHSYQHLPLMDFRPYKIGTHIQSGMEYPEGAAQDEFEILVVYSKDGSEKSFELDNLPDSTWQWVRTENKLIKKGYEPPIHDFVIESIDGEDKTQYFLSYPGYTFILVAHDLEKTDINNQENINNLAEFCSSKGHEFICITSSLAMVDDFSVRNEVYYDFYTMDEISLKTIIRSNPGLVVIKDGVILDKFHANDIPKPEDLDGDLQAHFIARNQSIAKKYLNYLLLATGLLFISILNQFSRVRKS